MLTNFLFLSILSSVSIYLAARFEKPFEQTLPLGVMSSILILYGFGLAGVLEVGMMFLYAAALLFYLLSVVHICRKRNWKGFAQNLVTPGAVFWCIICLVLSLCNYGKMASGWDEFSHWVDIVKAATYVDDFGNNPAANSMFQSYPPAMMLFQYILQKINMLLKPSAEFSEWRVYFAYQVFFVSVMLPFFRGITYRQPLKLALYAAITLLAPLLFYGNMYSAVYIDPILGILFGAGMSMVFLRSEWETVDTACICANCAVLTISKDVGLVFAIALALAYAVNRVLTVESLPVGKRILGGALALAAACLPKLLWSWELKTSGAQVSFCRKIDWPVLRDVILGKDTSYRSGLVHTYWEALNSKTISFAWLPLKFNYIVLLLVFCCILLVIWCLFRNKQPERGKQSGAVLGIAAVTLAGYIAGLCVIYMFKFSEYEAVRLASMERYLNIAFLGVWLIILLLLADWVCRRKSRWVLKGIMLVALLLAINVRPFVYFLRGDYVRQSVSVRTSYEPLRTAIQETCDGDDRIYLISQADKGFDYWVSRFNARPNSFNDNFTWSIGEPFYEGDVWTKKITPEEWQALLLEKYDYVAIYKVNDYFLTHFGPLFAQPDQIEVNALYRVNRETGLLDKCE